MSNSLPRLLKEPTGWIVIVLVAGFLYVQWPTRVREVPEPVYVEQQLDNGFSIRWEGDPELQSEANPEVWALRQKGVSFLVQTATLNGDFETIVTRASEEDRAMVAGAVQEPLVFGETFASYAFFDAESRVQRHRWYLLDEQWVKVSVLYKPSSDARTDRANAFLNSITASKN